MREKRREMEGKGERRRERRRRERRREGRRRKREITYTHRPTEYLGTVDEHLRWDHRCGLGVNRCPGSVPGRINFRVEVSLSHNTSVRKFVQHSSLGI